MAKQISHLALWLVSSLVPSDREYLNP